MSRTAQVLKSKLIAVIALAVILVGAGGGIWYHEAHSSHLKTITNAQHQLDEVSYRGKSNTTALKLLEQYTTVQTKHYSFGDMVTAINGISGTGPKYWTFYINGKEASVGAGSYITKSSDAIDWKLQ